jgi:light-regulated signal transduction histidine kinase (bacteriophytochrome)
VERKTLTGFIAAVALLVLLSGVAVVAVRGYGTSTRWVAHSFEVIGELEARADDFRAGVLSSAFAALLITATTLLAWLFLRIRREMAERKQQSAALDRANCALEAANRELESFSYSVSHDLRSPLRAIDGYAQMLEEDYGAQLDEIGRRYIRTVRTGSQRMAALIDDLLAFSRLSRQSLNRQTVDMTALARRAAAEVLEGQPEPKPAVTIAELPPVPGDPALLRQVWTNLIGNAVKYSSKSTTPEVQVRAAAQGRLVRYEVQDTGVGFDMKYADKLFGVFQRLHSLDDYPGTGVGLAIVQRIITRHEGAVTAQGERGKGATFGFTLPTEV